MPRGYPGSGKAKAKTPEPSWTLHPDPKIAAALHALKDASRKVAGAPEHSTPEDVFAGFAEAFNTMACAQAITADAMRRFAVMLDAKLIEERADTTK